MKKFLLAAIIIFCTAIILFATKSPSADITPYPFTKFDSSRIDVGEMYVYDYSQNIKSFQMSDKKYLYIKTLSNIEILDIDLDDSLDMPNITKYKINWNYMMLESEAYKYKGPKSDIGKEQLYTINLNIDFKNKTLYNQTYGRGSNGNFSNDNYVWKFTSIPTYFYQQTDLMDLWFALRFYPLDKEAITVNSIQSNYNNKFEIKYEGKEQVKVPFGNILCFKFELLPKLSFFMRLLHNPKKAYIWLASEDKYMYMVKYINNNEQYSVVPYMEYRLERRVKMRPEEWEKLKAKKISQRIKARENK